jgi:hypothetical protein
MEQRLGHTVVEQRRRAGYARWALAISLSGLCACNGTDPGALPPNVEDPATIRTPNGALARYHDALTYLTGAFDHVMVTEGILTDELAALPIQRGVDGLYTALDSRQDLTGVSQGTSDRLHRLRAQAREARGFLVAYAPDSSLALQAPLYAVEGYAELFLADLFCSGIPLSTVDFDGNYTLAAGSTMTKVYAHAVALFDSALALASDSVRIQQLSALGRGRGLLALGRYAEAAAAVAGVPDEYLYHVTFNYQLPDFSSSPAVPDSAALWVFANTYSSVSGTPSVADREGERGLDYRSSGDPRTLSLALGPDAVGDTMYFPAQYPQRAGR